MRKRPTSAKKKKIRNRKTTNLDRLLEEYTSKLEQKLVAQTQQLKTITDNATSCLFMIDTQGKPTYMNPAAEQITGYTLNEIKNTILHDILHHNHQKRTQNQEKACSILAAFQDLRQLKDQEDIFVKKDGSVFPVSFSISPLQERGRSQGAVLEFQDITKRKELERQKDDFIGVASHELKTPVTSMKTYTQVLKRQFEMQGNYKAAASLAKIDVQINKLTFLIADLLDVTRSQTGNLNLRPETFKIDQLIQEIVESMQLTTKKHTLVIKSKAAVEITADRDRISQVLINFLSNAIKYSPYSKRIIVGAVHKKQEILVSVQDFGIGIPTNKLEQIFERFNRVSGPQMETFAGLGLGLYISTQIITRHGGRIWVESKENKGSTFYFSLPYKSG